MELVHSGCDLVIGSDSCVKRLSQLFSYPTNGCRLSESLPNSGPQTVIVGHRYKPSEQGYCLLQCVDNECQNWVALSQVGDRFVLCLSVEHFKRTEVYNKSYI